MMPSIPGKSNPKSQQQGFLMPTTLEALILLFIFSVPAYLTITVYRARNPVHYYREKQSPIEQAALYIFLGTVVNILTISYIGLLWGGAILIRTLLPARAVSFLNILSNFFSGLFTVTFLFIIAYFATGAALSFLIGNILVHFLPIEAPLWITELKTLKVIQAKAVVGVTWVLVHLKNGDRCLGLVSKARWIGDENNTMELTLEKAFYQLADSEKKERVGRILLRSDDILWLSPYSE